MTANPSSPLGHRKRSANQGQKQEQGSFHFDYGRTKAAAFEQKQPTSGAADDKGRSVHAANC
jgi:hypothetical protein